jgi:hypothetical protein
MKHEGATMRPRLDVLFFSAVLSCNETKAVAALRLDIFSYSDNLREGVRKLFDEVR